MRKMMLAFHGGLCCGIKTIYGFPYAHEKTQLLKPLKAIKPDDGDQFGRPRSPNTRFFHEAAPAETALERLDRYIDYIKRRRPSHIVEAVLADGRGPNSLWDLMYWEPLLFERGFKLVTSHKNSNSGNTVHIYHLTISPEKKEKDY